MLVRIFLAIDDPATRARVVPLLEHPNIHVIEQDPGDSEGKRAEDDVDELVTRLGAQSYDIAILDHVPEGPAGVALVERVIRLPDQPWLLVVGDPPPESRAAWLAAGAVAVSSLRVEDALLRSTLVGFVDRRRRERLDRLQAARRSRARQPGFVSVSPAGRAVLETARRVASADTPVLILGETGVGKERLAALLHGTGPRSDGPFIAVNCAAIPAELFESELFGHHRGAFTGAVRNRRGKFELADRGTIFLDEVGEVPLHLQAKLLRVLQEGKISPVGSDGSIEIDARVIAATNRDLEVDMEAGRFRRDLYYRLGVVELTIPPLRERAEDIPVLAESYLTEFRAQLGREIRGFGPGVLTALERYPWPGNVRELVNVIERAVLLSRGELVGLDDLPESVATWAAHPTSTALAPPRDPSETPVLAAGALKLPPQWAELPWRQVRTALLEQGERAYLTALLRLNRGRIGETARQAGMSARSLFEKMRRHDLRKEDFRIEGQESDREDPIRNS